MTTPKLKPFKRTYRIFLFSIVSVIAALAAYASIFYMIQKIGRHTVELGQETAALEAQEAEVGQLRDNLAATQKEQSNLTAYFVDVTDVVPFFETIEGYGKDMGVAVKFNNVDTSKMPVPHLDVMLDATGSFTDVYRFISLLEAAPYEISITSATIESMPSAVTPVKGAPLPPEEWDAQISLSILSVTGVQ